MVDHWIIWYRLPLLYCSTKNHPALLHARTFAWFLSPRFEIFLALSASHHLATLRLASIAAKNLESLPHLVTL